ncbi:MAG: ABC transporter substrate-binding protein [Chloroflexi bacterium]|nr:ABC transporter substrate-binding protein [Chloroflexota bacterium]
MNRRALLRSMAGIGATLALSACAAPAPASPTQSTASTTGAAAPPSTAQAAAKPTAAAQSAPTQTAPGAAAETPKKGGTLVVGLEAEPGTLDNSVGTGYHTSIIQRLIYESLIGYDLTSNADVLPIKPVLAESWTLSLDGKVYTFKIRQGVKFHDGTPLDAAAIKWNFERASDPKHPLYFDKGRGTSAQIFSLVEKMEVPDPATFVITLKDPRAYFLALFDKVPMFIGSPSAIQKSGNDDFGNHPVGTGPFRFVSRDSGSKITLERNPNYWGTPVNLDQIVFRGISDPTPRVVALQTGEVDFINDVAPDQIEALRRNSDMVVSQASIPHTWLINLNHRDKPFSDVRVRQAASLAINREALTRDILKGTALSATQLEGPGGVAHNDALAGWPYDPARATQLLAEAGYPNGFETVFALPAAGSGMLDAVRIAEYLQKNWTDVGIRASLETQEWTSYVPYFFKGIPPEKGMYAMANVTGDGQDMEKLNASAFQPPNGFNVGWYKNDQVEQLLVQARSTPDPAAAAKVYQQVERILNDDVARIYILHSQQPKAFNKRVRGFVNPHSWAYTFTNVWLAT